MIQFSARTTFPTEYAFWKLKFPKRPLAHLAAPASRPESCPPRRRKKRWKKTTHKKKIAKNSPGCYRRWCGRPAGGHLRHRRCWPAPSPRWPAATWPRRRKKRWKKIARKKTMEKLTVPEPDVVTWNTSAHNLETETMLVKTFTFKERCYSICFYGS